MSTTNASALDTVPMASVELFGYMPKGDPVHRICLQSRVKGMVCGASILTRGATVQEVSVPDKAGQVEDVVLGFHDLEGYNGPTNFCYGGTPGRYANRISQSSFELEHEEESAGYQPSDVKPNPKKLIRHMTSENWDGPESGKKHTLHGGVGGFDGKVWKIEQGPWVDSDGSHVSLAYTSPDGEMGFPGTLTAHVKYSWKACSENSTYELKIIWSATTDQKTVVNLTNHSYFNLDGVKGATDILETHTAMLNCDQWTEVDGDAIPTGRILDVAGTPMDFRSPKKIGEHIKDAQGGGYDHNYVVRGEAGVDRLVARVESGASGRCLECWATQPGVQFFTMQPASVFDKATTGKFGAVYPVHGGFCVETQHFPDSPNRPDFPSTVLKPGQTYKESCSYRFGVCKDK